MAEPTRVRMPEEYPTALLLRVGVSEREGMGASRLTADPLSLMGGHQAVPDAREIRERGCLCRSGAGKKPSRHEGRLGIRPTGR